MDGDAGKQGSHPEEGPAPVSDQDFPGYGEENTDPVIQVIITIVCIIGLMTI